MLPARLPPLPTLLVISMSLQHVPPQSEEEKNTRLPFHLIRHVGSWFVFFSSHQIVCVLSLWHVAQHWEQCIFSITRKVSERRSVRSLSLSCVLFCSREMCQFGKPCFRLLTLVSKQGVSASSDVSQMPGSVGHFPPRTRKGCRCEQGGLCLLDTIFHFHLQRT